MLAALYGRKCPWQTEKWTGCPLFSKVSLILIALYHILILKAMLTKSILSLRGNSFPVGARAVDVGPGGPL
jgi:hypothetical protein